VRVRDQYTSPDRRVDSRASSSVVRRSSFVVRFVVRLHPSWRRGQTALGIWGGWVARSRLVDRWVHGEGRVVRLIDIDIDIDIDVEMSIDRSIAPSRANPRAARGRGWRQRATTVGASTQTVTTPPRTRTSVLIFKLAHTTTTTRRTRTR